MYNTATVHAHALQQVQKGPRTRALHGYMGATSGGRLNTN